MPDALIFPVPEKFRQHAWVDPLTYGPDQVDVVNLDGPVTTRSETRIARRARTGRRSTCATRR